MLLVANTHALRQEWIRALEKVEALDPMYVVPCHRLAEEVDGVWHIAASKKYIQDFDDLMEAGPSGPEEVMDAMLKKYPERFNPGILAFGLHGTFEALANSHQGK